MSSSALRSTYRRYKEDTNAVVSWLATTAEQLGAPPQLLDLSSESQTDEVTKPTRRLKGKARKEAALAHKIQAQAHTVSGTQISHVIKIKNFVPLAEFLVLQAAVVPPRILRTLQRVITARSAFGAKLQ